MFNTKYYIKYNSKYTNSCFVFSFLDNLKLKIEVIIAWKSLRVTELTFDVAEFAFQKLQYVQKNTIYRSSINNKCDDKDFMQIKQWKNSALLSLTTWMFVTRCEYRRQ